MAKTLASFLMYYLPHNYLLESILNTAPTQMQLVPLLDWKPGLGWGRGRWGKLVLTRGQVSSVQQRVNM